MRKTLFLTACPALALCGVVALATGSALADAGPGNGNAGTTTTFRDAPTPSAEGTATVSIQQDSAQTGQTVEVTGAAPPRLGGSFESLTTDAGTVHMTDTNPQHIRGTLTITAGAGTYDVKLAFSNGTANTALHVVASSHAQSAPGGPKPAPEGARRHVPNGAPRTGAAGPGGGDRSMMLAAG